jgi:hypothetical protein
MSPCNQARQVCYTICLLPLKLVLGTIHFFLIILTHSPSHSDSLFAFGPIKSRSSAYAAWGEMATKLEDEAFRIEYVLVPFLIT